MLSITKDFLDNRITRPALRNKEFYTIRKLKGIVAHWTANERPGADAAANRNYFNTTDRRASAHYIIDDKTIIQCIPDTEVAYHVGGRYYRPDGERIMEDDLTPNYFLIGFEMCVNSDGDWNKTYQNSIDLARHLLNKYNLTTEDMYRHFDITGKHCPKMMMAEEAWMKFKKDIEGGLFGEEEIPLLTGSINTSLLNVRQGPGIDFDIVDVIKEEEKVYVFEINEDWVRIGLNRWVHGNFVTTTYKTKSGIVQVDDPDGLNVRSGPGMEHGVMETLPDGSTVSIMSEEGNWLQIGFSRWVFNRYIKIKESKTGRVSVPEFLNVRSGPGTTNDRVDRIADGTRVHIFEDLNGWYRIGEDRWVYGAFVEINDQ